MHVCQTRHSNARIYAANPVTASYTNIDIVVLTSFEVGLDQIG